MKYKTKISALAGIIVFLALVLIGPAMAKKYDSGKAWIGVYTQTIDEDLREAFDLDMDKGAVIVDVVDDSPADDAGLRRKDIVVKFNGQSVVDSDDLADFVEELEKGDEAELVIVRKGEEKTLKVEIGESSDFKWYGSRSGSSFKMPRMITRDFSYSMGTHGYIGVAIQNLSDQLGEYFGVKDGEGVLVTEVFEDSPAEEAGLKAGDVIVSIDGESVAETDELQEIISEMEEGDQVAVDYIRKGTKGQVSVEVTEDDFGMSNFTIPDLNIRIPDLSGLKNLDHFYFSDDDDEYFDAKEYNEEMQQLKEEMKELSKELREIKSKLD